MIELGAEAEPLERERFPKLLRQAHDAEIIDLSKEDDGAYAVRLRPEAVVAAQPEAEPEADEAAEDERESADEEPSGASSVASEVASQPAPLAGIPAPLPWAPPRSVRSWAGRPPREEKGAGRGR